MSDAMMMVGIGAVLGSVISVCLVMAYLSTRSEKGTPRWWVHQIEYGRYVGYVAKMNTRRPTRHASGPFNDRDAAWAEADRINKAFDEENRPMESAKDEE